MKEEEFSQGREVDTFQLKLKSVGSVLAPPSPQHHLNTITNNTRTHHDGHVLVHLTTHHVLSQGHHFTLYILCCRLLFSL